MKNKIVQHGPWKTTSVKCVYSSPWISVDKCDVINPGGKEGEYGTVHFKNFAIGIVALDDDLNTWIVGQYRYPLKNYTWEIPEGGGKLLIPSLASAKRELEEETGIIAAKWDELLQMHLSNSASDELAIIYLARNLSFVKPHPDENEKLELLKLPFDDFYKKVISGEITDSLSVAAAFRLRIMQLEGDLTK